MATEHPTTSRRSILVASTAATLASPAGGRSRPRGSFLSPDPVYAGIERYGQAYEAQGTACNRTDNVMMAAIAAGVRWRDCSGFAEAEEAAQEAAGRADCAALSEPATTAPTTIAGVAALARYVADFCEPDGIEGETAITALGTIADALPALMGKGPARV
jgi:hypothetical protein